VDTGGDLLKRITYRCRDDEKYKEFQHKILDDDLSFQEFIDKTVDDYLDDKYNPKYDDTYLGHTNIEKINYKNYTINIKNWDNIDGEGVMSFVSKNGKKIWENWRDKNKENAIKSAKRFIDNELERND
jgi:hypothetical protein